MPLKKVNYTRDVQTTKSLIKHNSNEFRKSKRTLIARITTNEKHFMAVAVELNRHLHSPV
jgi:hypothetical protein